MNEDYAINWLVRHYSNDIGSWPLGMVKKCAEMMAVYSNEILEFKMKQLAKESLTSTPTDTAAAEKK